MRITLKDFQTNAVAKALLHLHSARRDAPDTDQAVVLSAPTGSGKTVIATSLIETVLFGSDAAPGDPAAVFLWITDLPELNEQTKRKMISTSSKLGPDKLVVIESDFDDERLAPGRVYFVNTQKLGSAGNLVRPPGDLRRHTFWETVNNTISDASLRLVLVIDEAHRGMSENKKERDRATSTIQRFLKGTSEMRAVPVVLGISATPQRFEQLLAGTERTKRPITVTPADVRGSGLIKDKVVAIHPTETQPGDVTLLREAARTWQTYASAWGDYCAAESEAETVRPLFIVQVADGTGGVISTTNIAGAISAIRAVAGNLPDEAFAHAFQDGGTLTFGATSVRYLRPSDISEDPTVGVVFFKSSLNTGWDCPQAEVMMSFRTANDYTNIAQLVGRMVRTPLARRIDGDERLNAVYLYLPHYSSASLKDVIAYLQNSGESAGDTEFVEEQPAVLTHAVGSEDLFLALAQVPNYTLPRRRRISDVRRLARLARALSADRLDPEAETRERAGIVARLVAEHDALAADLAYAAIVAERGTLALRRAEWTVEDSALEDEEFEISVAEENIEDLFSLAGRKLGEGLHVAYYKTRAGSDSSQATIAKLEIIALSMRPDVLGRLEAHSRTRIRALLDAQGPKVPDLPERRRQVYAELRQLSAEPEEMKLSLPTTIEVAPDEPRRERHIYANGDGLAPIKLGGWEELVLAGELAKPEVVGWLRNYDRKPWSLLVPYEFRGNLQPLFPDFLFVRRTNNGVVVDLLDPHNPGLDDAPAKAKGLVAYTQRHGHLFGRVELIAVFDGVIRRLDLKDEGVRARINRAETTDALTLVFGH
jgi:type III restriction enzyme